MKSQTEKDVRYPGLTKAGASELQIYLDWIQANKLSDSEQSFVNFTIGRGVFADGRHLFRVWEYCTKDMQVDSKTKLLIMRFFINPTQESFAIASVARWFDFLPTAYMSKDKVKVESIKKPEYLEIT